MIMALRQNGTMLPIHFTNWNGVLVLSGPFRALLTVCHWLSPLLSLFYQLSTLLSLCHQSSPLLRLCHQRILALLSLFYEVKSFARLSPLLSLFHQSVSASKEITHLKFISQNCNYCFLSIYNQSFLERHLQIKHREHELHSRKAVSFFLAFKF